MNEIDESIRAVRRRLRRQSVWNGASLGLLIGGGPALVLSGVWVLTDLHVGWLLLIGCLAAGSLVGALAGGFRHVSDAQAAALLDERCRLKDRVITAVRLKDHPEREPWRALQRQDACRHLAGCRADAVVPIVRPRSWWPALVTAYSALMLAGFGRSAPSDADAAAVDPVVEQRVSEIERQMESFIHPLQELSEKRVEELLQQQEDMQAVLQELQKQIRNRRLSDRAGQELMVRVLRMEAVLEERQADLADGRVGEQLAEIGDILTLAEPLRPVGQALSERRFDEAAGQLEQTDLPELTAPEQHALAEELREWSSRPENSPEDVLKEAVERAADAVEQKDGRQFRESMQDLAELAEREHQRRDLARRLQRRLMALSDLKSDLAASVQLPGPRRGRPDGQPGRGSGDDGSESSEPLSQAGPSVRLPGRLSDEGDVQTETVLVTPEAAEAVRRYRQQQETWERLAESAVTTDRIPPGHRETIRRYFEGIRRHLDRAESSGTAAENRESKTDF